MYDERYYQRGEELGVSCYTNYRWLEDVVYPLAFRIIELLHLKENETILDHGCSFGYLVRALRKLYRQAWGIDISSYAISQVPEDTKPYVRLVEKNMPFPPLIYANSARVGFSSFDWITSRDVLEHISYENIGAEVLRIRQACRKAFIVVPLAENGKYVIEQAEHDSTHIIRENATWWFNLFVACGFTVTRLSFHEYGIKSPAYDKYERGYLYAFLE